LQELAYQSKVVAGGDKGAADGDVADVRSTVPILGTFFGV